MRSRRKLMYQCGRHFVDTLAHSRHAGLLSAGQYARTAITRASKLLGRFWKGKPMRFIAEAKVRWKQSFLSKSSKHPFCNSEGQSSRVKLHTVHHQYGQLIQPKSFCVNTWYCQELLELRYRSHLTKHGMNVHKTKSLGQIVVAFTVTNIPSPRLSSIVLRSLWHAVPAAGNSGYQVCSGDPRPVPRGSVDTFL